MVVSCIVQLGELYLFAIWRTTSPLSDRKYFTREPIPSYFPGSRQERIWCPRGLSTGGIKNVGMLYVFGCTMMECTNSTSFFEQSPLYRRQKTHRAPTSLRRGKATKQSLGLGSSTIQTRDTEWSQVDRAVIWELRPRDICITLYNESRWPGVKCLFALLTTRFRGIWIGFGFALRMTPELDFVLNVPQYVQVL